MPITALPTPPARSMSSDAFVAAADAFLGALPTFQAEANALEANVNGKEVTTAASATAAATSASSASNSAIQASTSASQAALYGTAVLWVSGTTYAVGNVVVAPANKLLYKRKVAGAGTTDPSLDATNWESVGLAGGASHIKLSAILATLPALTIVDHCFHLERDDTPRARGWRRRKGQSWRSEARSVGTHWGSYATATLAVAAGAIVGDVYYNTTSSAFHVVTGATTSTVTYRAGREDYPTNALITAEAARVIIWDLDGAVPSMWMVFEGTTFGYLYAPTTIVKVVSALNADLIIGTSDGGTTYGGISWVNFAKDKSIYSYLNNVTDAHYRCLNPVSGRNTTTSGDRTLTAIGPALVNHFINDVALTVLPDAPIDENGMPVPTIFCSTAAGVSVVNNNGVVADLVDVAGDATYEVAFDKNNNIYFTNSTQGDLDMFLSTNYDADDTTPDANYDNTTIPALLAAITTTKYGLVQTGKGLAVGHNTGVSRLVPSTATKANGMIAYITSTYNTGWMVGDIRRCFLSDGLSASDSLSGTNLTASNPDGTFATSTGWTLSAAAAIGGGVATITNGTANNAEVYHSTVLTTGRVYSITYTIVVTTGGCRTDAGIPHTASGTYTDYFTAVSGLLAFRSTALNSNFTIDDVVVREAALDRSVKAQGITDIGAVTRTAYTGGRTVYSGFSAANYLQEASHADWNALGTGNFSIIMSGVKWGTAGTLKTILSIGNGASEGSLSVEHLAANTLRLYIWTVTPTKTTICTSTATFTDTAEHVLEIKRSGTTCSIVVDGVVVASGTSAITISNATGFLRIGEGQDASQPFAGGQCSCIRISATAPTAEQSKFIAATENALNSGHACLLSNSSTVSQLDYYSRSDMLAVGNGTNTDFFNNLAREGVITTSTGATVSGTLPSEATFFHTGTTNTVRVGERNVEAELTEQIPAIPKTQYYSFTSSGTTQALPQGWKARGVAFNLTDGTMLAVAQTFDGFVYTQTGLTNAKAYQVELEEVL